MTIKPGEIWIANIPFTNGMSSKKRPVLVLWVDGNDAIVALVTSALPRTQTDVILNDWESSSLRVASTVRLSRLDCLEQLLLFSKLGTISQADAAQIRDIWQLYIKPQF